MVLDAPLETQEPTMLTGYPPDDRFQARQLTAVARACAPATVFCCAGGVPQVQGTAQDPSGFCR